MPRALILILLALTLAACDRASSPPAPTAPASSPRGEPDDTYTVRGQVEQIPTKDKPTSEFMVHHEAIDNFKNPNGKLGMNSMSMPFPLAKGLALDGITPGDIVELEFVVWTKPGHRGYEVRRITKLPADTQLHFGKANPKP
jgi:Cu/Ag efflux protein CusF